MKTEIKTDPQITIKLTNEEAGMLLDIIPYHRIDEPQKESDFKRLLFKALQSFLEANAQ